MFFLDLQTLRAGDEGWLVLDVTAASDRWLLSRNKDLGLRLFVETEDGKAQGWAAAGTEPAAATSFGPGGLASLSPVAGVIIPYPLWGFSRAQRVKFPQQEVPYHDSLPPLLLQNQHFCR